MTLHTERTMSDEKNLESLRSRHDGHCTIFFFTTGVKVIGGTPDLTHEFSALLESIPSYGTLDEAIRYASQAKAHE